MSGVPQIQLKVMLGDRLHLDVADFVPLAVDSKHHHAAASLVVAYPKIAEFLSAKSLVKERRKDRTITDAFKCVF